LALFNAKISSGFVDPYETLEELYDDEATLMRQRLPREEVQRREREAREAELDGMRAGASAGGGQAMDPALAGAMLGGAPE